MCLRLRLSRSCPHGRAGIASIGGLTLAATRRQRQDEDGGDREENWPSPKGTHLNLRVPCAHKTPKPTPLCPSYPMCALWSFYPEEGTIEIRWPHRLVRSSAEKIMYFNGFRRGFRKQVLDIGRSPMLIVCLYLYEQPVDDICFQTPGGKLWNAEKSEIYRCARVLTILVRGKDFVASACSTT